VTKNKKSTWAAATYYREGKKGSPDQISFELINKKAGAALTFRFGAHLFPTGYSFQAGA